MQLARTTVAATIVRYNLRYKSKLSQQIVIFFPIPTSLQWICIASSFLSMCWSVVYVYHIWRMYATCVYMCFVNTQFICSRHCDSWSGSCIGLVDWITAQQQFYENNAEDTHLYVIMNVLMCVVVVVVVVICHMRLCASHKHYHH